MCLSFSKIEAYHRIEHTTAQQQCNDFVEGWVIQQQKRNWHYRLSVIYAKVEVIFLTRYKSPWFFCQNDPNCQNDTSQHDDEKSDHMAGFRPLQLQFTARTQKQPQLGRNRSFSRLMMMMIPF